MKNIKRVTILYLSCLFALIIIKILFGGQVSPLLKSWGLWVLPLLAILAAQIVGVVATLIFSNPHLKQKVFNVSFLMVFIGFVSTTARFSYSNWRHKKNFGNIEANQDYFKYFAGDNASVKKIAFDSLSKLFTDPNSFQITGTSVKWIDTTVTGYAETAYFITFQYKKETEKSPFKSQYAVLKNIAHLIYFDVPFDKNDIQRIDSLNKTAIKNIKEAMRLVPDSIKNEFKNEFPEIMDE